MSENASTETVDLRIKRSRKFLIEALFALMQDHPFHKITVQDITQQAMVNRSTFYAHFTDKYDLFKTATGQRMRRDLKTGIGESSGLTHDNLRSLIVVSGDLMKKISYECKPTSVDELVPLIMSEMQDSIHEIVLSWASARDVSEAQAETLAMFTSGVIFGAVALWGRSSDDRSSIEQLADQLMPLLMDGVGQYAN